MMFYNRYIPPKSHNLEPEEVSEPEISPPPSPPPKAVKEKKEPKKPKKRKLEPEPDQQEREESPPKRHEAVFAKFNKAAKLSERLKQNPPAEPPKEPTPELHDLQPIPQPLPLPEPEYNPTFSSLPGWLSDPVVTSSSDRTTFDSLHLPEKILNNLHKNDYKDTFPIQTKLIPMIKWGPEKHFGDICVSAPTGSGKTLAYLLPIIAELPKLVVTQLRAIIVVPTRELVSQARLAARMAAAGVGIQIGAAVGSNVLDQEKDHLIHKGQDYNPTEYQAMKDQAIWRLKTGFLEEDSLFDDLEELPSGYVPAYSSKVDILICTPGRLVEHIQSTKGFSLQHLLYLVIDEVDQLLHDRFHEWVDVILKAYERDVASNIITKVTSKSTLIKRPRMLQKIILSASMTRDVGKLAILQLERPTLLAVLPDKDSKHHTTALMQLPSTLREIAIPVGDGSQKPLYALKLLTNIFNESENARVLVFVNTTEDALRLSHILPAMHKSFRNVTDTLTKVSSKRGRTALLAFQSGKLKLLIATDRASRGLDLTDLTDVVSYDMPRSLEDYVHRVGRTARADRSGTAYTLHTKSEARWFFKDIAGSKNIGRSSSGKVDRVKLELDDTESSQRKYEKALESLRLAVQKK
jgi:ATP-dependent RNA helicase DDX51/DBP6